MYKYFTPRLEYLVKAVKQAVAANAVTHPVQHAHGLLELAEC